MKRWAAIGAAIVLGVLGILLVPRTEPQLDSKQNSGAPVATLAEASSHSVNDTVHVPTAAPRAAPAGKWARISESETRYLKRETWVLEVAGLRVYPTRERVTTRARDSGAVLQTSGESESGATPAQPTGAFRLNEAQARQRAQMAWEQWGPLKGPARAVELEKVAWAEDRTDGAPSRLAYRVLEQGRETVIDGESGEVLLRADRRVRN